MLAQSTKETLNFMTNTSSNTPEQDIQEGRTVLDTEIQGLEKLRDSLNQSFFDAVDIIHALKVNNHRGRLIVAGIGKSGHIARKIAATMASTGTPAYFVHPGEASHGDMGMITQNDTVLMLSNSGENAELSDLIHFTRRYGLKLIAMTSKPDSTLAQNSDVALLLPQVPESCPNGLAPTTSTTMMIALGDALAVALLKRQDLTPEQYKVFHPGGKLGQKLMLVSELMVPRSDMPLITIGSTMDEAIIVMMQKNLGSVVVINEDGSTVGIITDGDLKRHMSRDLLGRTVEEIMSPNPKTISDNKLAAEAIDIMSKTPGCYLTSLLAVDNNGIATGLIRLQDCLQAGL